MFNHSFEPGLHHVRRMSCAPLLLPLHAPLLSSPFLVPPCYYSSLLLPEAFICAVVATGTASASSPSLTTGARRCSSLSWATQGLQQPWEQRHGKGCQVEKGGEGTGDARKRAGPAPSQPHGEQEGNPGNTSEATTVATSRVHCNHQSPMGELH